MYQRWDWKNPVKMQVSKSMSTKSESLPLKTKKGEEEHTEDDGGLLSNNHQPNSHSPGTV